jgi:predicted RNA-binding Zn-ribbon protein involved in translation (DUF1610 family)
VKEMDCKKCGKEIIKLPLTEKQKLDIYILIQNDLRLFLEQKLVSDFNLNKEKVKAVIGHLNKKQNCCTACGSEVLAGEFTECPDCGAFNYNLQEPVFNVEFCSHLEWSLDFSNTKQENTEYYVESFWCDGILHIPEDPESLLYDNLKRDKQIITKAWIGYGGQDIYEMKIKFGRKSLSNYKNGENIIGCIPKAGRKEKWITLDVNKRKIEVQLK